LKQIICKVKIRATPARYDNIDFQSLVIKDIRNATPSYVVTDDRVI
jgi:hypothetical protein